MSNLAAVDLAHSLEVRDAVSISALKSKTALEAIVTKISTDKVNVRILKPTSPFSFTRAQAVLLKYRDEEALYYFSAKILDVVGSVVVLSGSGISFMWENLARPSVSNSRPLGRSNERCAP